MDREREDEEAPTVMEDGPASWSEPSAPPPVPIAQPRPPQATPRLPVPPPPRPAAPQPPQNRPAMHQPSRPSANNPVTLPGGRVPRPPETTNTAVTVPKPTKKPSWLRRVLRYLAAAFGLGAAAIVGTIWFYSQELPTLETLSHYRPPTVTIVKDREGRLLGEIYEQRRYVVEMDEIPAHVRDAFLAAEDANFYNHKGVDPVGIARAIGRNLVQGKMAQGASTITQQVARNFLLSSEKKLSRKIKEAILARRIEEAFDKEKILYLYLNQIYLGSGAYGVEAASRIYFDKHVGDLTVAEAAILAGLPQRPSEYSPHRSWDKARSRQEYVIGQMVDKKFITKAEGDAALAEEVKIVKTENPIRILAPYYTEHVRRYLVDTYGFDRVYNEGLIVTTPCDLELQQLAQSSVIEHVTDIDTAMGWRGATEHLDGDAAIAARREQQETAMRDLDQFNADNARREPLPARSTLHVDDKLEGVVLAVEAKHMIVGAGRHEVIVPLSWTKWAFKPDPERSWRYRAIEDLNAAFKVGDVVTVQIANLDSSEVKELNGYAPAAGKAAARIFQAPALQGAFLSWKLDDGAVLSMVGGVDIEASEFNRAIQARRQVGSTFKPIVYAAAIESKKFTAGSILVDAPQTYNTLDEKLWKPGNYGEEYLGNITLRRALAMSRNVCTVQVSFAMGIDPTYNMARKLGIESPLEMDHSLALGSGALTMVELTRAYTAFATGGNLVEPYFIDSVEDRDGNVLEQHTAIPPKPVLDPAVSGIMTWLLTEVATVGTAAEASRLGVHAAGKTGTTNDFKDAWFVGYTPGIIGTAWVGYDQPKSMGVSSTGGKLALPIWMDFMAKAWPKSADHGWPDAPGLIYAPIDESTGRVATGGRSMPFLPGTVPEATTAAVGQTSTEDLLTRDF